MMVTIWTQAYNAEKHIRQCIESVLQQSYTDFEYIIVDDGSTDGTWDIIEEYARTDLRIRAFHEDTNVGGVRYQRFLQSVTGEYFAALDSDDWLEPDFLMELFRFCQAEHLDIGVCGTRYFMEAENRFGVLRNPRERVVFRTDETPRYFSTIHEFLRPIWGKLIRTEILHQANLSLFHRFIERRYKGFDTAFSMALFQSSKTVGMLNKCLHNYRITKGSTFYAFSPQRYDAYEALYDQTIEVLTKFGELSPFNRRFTSLVFFSAVKDVLDIAIASDLPEQDKISYVGSILIKPRVVQLRQIDDADDGLVILMPYILWILDREGSLIRGQKFGNILMPHAR